jgi:uncharacterized protein YlxP (DUF503 family)
MLVGVLIIELSLPGCKSLKEKRRRIAPILHQVHARYNVSIAEIEHQDVWQSAGLGCAFVSNRKTHVENTLRDITHFIESHWPDEMIINDSVEIL